MPGIIIANKTNVDKVNADIQKLGFTLAVRDIEQLCFAAPGCDFYLLMVASTDQLNQLIKQLDAIISVDIPKIIFIDKQELSKVDLDLIDDFVTLPFDQKELQKRLQFHLKRQAISKNILRVEGLVLNRDSYEVTANGLPVTLTYKEFELLKFLMSNPRRVFHRQQLMEAIWECDFFSGARTVDVHIRRLRAKLGPKYSHHIKTVRNVGYLFDR